MSKKIKGVSNDHRSRTARSSRRTRRRESQRTDFMYTYQYWYWYILCDDCKRFIKSETGLLIIIICFGVGIIIGIIYLFSNLSKPGGPSSTSTASTPVMTPSRTPKPALPELEVASCGMRSKKPLGNNTQIETDYRIYGGELADISKYPT